MKSVPFYQKVPFILWRICLKVTPLREVLHSFSNSFNVDAILVNLFLYVLLKASCTDESVRISFLCSSPSIHGIYMSFRFLMALKPHLYMLPFSSLSSLHVM
ncbi:hypothetical protein CHARACLAT_029673 [Characodon lateralis]|uniref:Uncharacterized protein n=1 Tax=Characodon lateralis TaxID=208331 RepID=A0ABU7ENZ6_9TELE|nr:hypothetical protein [Characodon lateralis]